MQIDLKRLEKIARQVRGTIVELSMTAQAPHVGSSLSCVDILVAAYWCALRIDPGNPDDPDRDRLILSKGHGAQALYTVLNFKGFFDEELNMPINESKIIFYNVMTENDFTETLN